jgi:uncharacterized caspase-like protein
LSQLLQHARLAGKKGIGIFYYAGHGVQRDWRNYLIPVDGEPANASELEHKAVDLNEAIAAFKNAGNRLNVFVLDACRDNPFGISSSKGLGPMNAPTNTLLASATAPGNVADDGANRNGRLPSMFGEPA